MELKVKRLHSDAKLPEKKSKDAAAFDIFACENTILTPQKVTKVYTGLSVEFSNKFKLEVYSRSGLASKGIFVANQPGKIDADYRGQIIVLLFNSTDFTYEVSKGDRVAQIEIQEVVPTDIVEVDALTETERGEGGFGSTGK